MHRRPSTIFAAVAILFLACAANAGAAPRFKAVAFDYFVIFNPNSVVPEVDKANPGKGLEFTKAWRAKQFEYGFQRSQLGFGSAVAVILFVISLVFALVYQRFVLRRDLEGALTRRVG